MKQRAFAAALLVLVALTGTVQARGHLQTRQTRVELAPGVRAGRLVLANTGDAPVAAQVRVYRWTQKDGADVLAPDPGLVPSPQVLEISAGGEQLVRIVRADATPVANEQAYRIVVDELPGDPAEDASAAVAVRLRYLIPAFVRAADAAPESVQCAVRGEQLECSNRGGRAAQLGASEVLDAHGRSSELTDGLLGYVLAGSQRDFPFQPRNAAGLQPTQLRVLLNGLPTTLDLVAGP